MMMLAVQLMKQILTPMHPVATMITIGRNGPHLIDQSQHVEQIMGSIKNWVFFTIIIPYFFP